MKIIQLSLLTLGLSLVSVNLTQPSKADVTSFMELCLSTPDCNITNVDEGNRLVEAVFSAELDPLLQEACETPVLVMSFPDFPEDNIIVTARYLSGFAWGRTSLDYIEQSPATVLSSGCTNENFSFDIAIF